MKNQTKNYYETLKNIPIDEVITRMDSHIGYEREAALLILTQSKHINLLPAYIIRANDWVKRVSILAQKAITDLLIQENRKQIIYRLPEIFHLQKCKRNSHEALLKAVSDYLLQPELRQDLLATVSSSNIKRATIAFELIINNNLYSDKDVILLGIKNKGIMIAKQSLRLADKLSDEEFLGISHQFIYHRSAYVVSKSIKRLINIDISLIDDQLTDLLFHRSEEIRRIAQQRSIELGLKPAEIYLAALKCEKHDHHKKARAISGISEVKNLESLPLLQELMSHEENSYLYKIIIETILKLLKDDAKSVIFPYLVNIPLPAETLSSIATLCKKYYIAYSWSELLDIYNGVNKDITFLFKLSKTGSKWNKLVLYLEIADKNITNNETVELMFSYWISQFTKQSIKPTKTEQFEIAKRLHTVSDKIPVDTAKSVSFLTESFL